MTEHKIIKQVIWIGNTRKVMSKFSLGVKRAMGHALYFAQMGIHHSHTKMMKCLGSGVFEIIEDYRGDTFRAVYTVKYAHRLYIVHVFQKKSKSGMKTPQEDINLIKERLKKVEEIEHDK